jgi:hypothetical protein
VLVAAIALICAVPSATNAQLMPLQDDPSWGPRLRITPFVGYLPSVTRHERWVHTDGSETTDLRVDYNLNSATAIGLNGEVVMRGPWSALAGVMYASRGDSDFALSSGGEFEINGSRFLFARAGASYALREKETELTMRRLSASVTVAPFYMREMPRSEGVENLEVFDPSNHFGLSVGIAGELPFARDRMSLQLGVEDYATWWSSGALRRLPDSFFSEGASATASTRVDSDVSNVWLIRAGLSYRW